MLGGYYGEESLNTEFKQFCNQFPSLLEEYFNEDELEEFLLNGRWTDKVNDLVNENIINYMAYIPQKYISCFGNSKIKGNLIIGVDDSGEITGIPYNGNLDLDYIKSLLKNTISKNIISEMSSEKIMSNINIKVKKLEVIHEILSDEINEIYEIFKESKKKQISEESRYKEELKIWHKDISVYTGKLYKLINDKKTRVELIEFIKNKCSDIILKAMLLDELNSDKEIKIPDGQQIFIDRNHKGNIIYWLTEFKDYMVQNILKKKPQKVNIALKNIYHLAGNFSYLRKKFVNNDINHYLIEIEIDGTKFNKDIYFKLPNSSRQYWRKRIELDGTPCCF
tara:strand:+ start:1865 stop:2875 length:1011 start_codon:yes stop_codon:yes gene_type:complete